jgi:hypothetical protein
VLSESNIGIAIGTSMVIGDASLVLVQTPAPNKRITEMRCRSDLTCCVRSTVAYCAKLRTGLTSVTNVDFML